MHTHPSRRGGSTLQFLGVLALLLILALGFLAARVFAPLPNPINAHERLTEFVEAALPPEGASPDAPDRYKIVEEVFALSATHARDEIDDPERRVRTIVDPARETRELIEQGDASDVGAYLAALEAGGAVDRLDEVANAPRAVRVLDENVALFENLLPDLGESRALAQVLMVELRAAIRQDDADRARDALRRSLLLARAFEFGPYLIEGLVGIAIQTATLDTLREELARLDSPSSELLERLDKAMRAHTTTFDAVLAFEGERHGFIDAVQRMYRGQFSTGGVADETTLPPIVLRLAASERETLGAGNALYDRFIEIAKLDDPRARRDTLDELDRQWEAGELYSGRLLLLDILLPAIGSALANYDLADMQVRGTRVMLAIERYRVDHDGTPPSSLDVLVPDYLDVLPLDPLTDDASTFGYRVLAPDADPILVARSGIAADDPEPETHWANRIDLDSPRPYLLWSVGADNTDDDGSRPSNGDNSRALSTGSRAAPSSDYILNDPPVLPEAEQEEF